MTTIRNSMTAAGGKIGDALKKRTKSPTQPRRLVQQAGAVVSTGSGPGQITYSPKSNP